MAYPDRKFTDKEAVLLKRSVKGRILDLVKGTKAPIFQGTSDRDGAVIFNCADVETGEWLKSLSLSRATIKLPAKVDKGSEDEKGGAEPVT
jgi:hypothetical protein